MCKVALIFVLVVQFSIAQNVKKPWRVNEKLEWSDFRGGPDPDSPYSASTYSGISYRYTAKTAIKKVHVTFEVACYFIPDKSWVKEGFESDKKLLAHEQLHFDITELFARKLHQKLKNTRFTKNHHKQIKTIYNTILNKRKLMQELYDAETNHSDNEVLQKKWEIKIAKLLKKMNHFASK